MFLVGIAMASMGMVLSFPSVMTARTHLTNMYGGAIVLTGTHMDLLGGLGYVKYGCVDMFHKPLVKYLTANYRMSALRLL